MPYLEYRWLSLNPRQVIITNEFFIEAGIHKMWVEKRKQKRNTPVDAIKKMRLSIAILQPADLINAY